MKAQLLETWQIHNNKNYLLLDNISDAGLQATLSNRGGRTVFLQLLHVHNIRMQWLEICAKDIFTSYKILDKSMPVDRKLLRKALEDSAKGIGTLLGQSWEEGGKLKGFRKGVIPFLGYLISHESHHRGSILLTLKQSGEKITDLVKWGLWEWGN